MIQGFYKENTEDILSEFNITANSIIRLKDGRNSRTWKIVACDNNNYILKEYGSKNKSICDRLNREYSFLKFLNKHGITNVPIPLFKNPQKNIAIYSFLEGDTVKKIKDSHISQCIEFIYNINSLKKKKDARKLVDAAEAFFSLQEHIDCVDNRLKALLEIEIETKEHQVVYDFVSNSLLTNFELIRNKILKEKTEAQLNKRLSEEEKIISPSDFGFHNILEFNKQLFFLDFEYAGWDDLAKTICDFRSQPEFLISNKHKEIFIDELTSTMNIPSVKERSLLLEPLYQLKWCCILLNEFKKDLYNRRIHSMGHDRIFFNKQLNKATEYFKNNSGVIDGLY